MFKKLTQIVENGSAYKALYAYDITYEKTIPVIIVESYKQHIVDELQVISQPWWIILTEDDINHGHDVYSIILHHICCRGELIVWDDVLWWLVMTKDEMRPHLEAHIRRMLIDLRETLVYKKMLFDVVDRLTIQADRLRCACGFMIQWTVHWWSIADIVALIEERRWVDHNEIYRTLHHGTWSLSLLHIHDLLEDLVAYVDTIPKNTTTK